VAFASGVGYSADDRTSAGELAEEAGDSTD